MIFVKSTLPVFIIEEPTEEVVKNLTELKAIIHRTENSIYIFPDPEGNILEWEWDVMEILKP